jgi:hypothetical protein
MKKNKVFIIAPNQMKQVYGGRKVETSFSDDCGVCYTDEIKYIFGIEYKRTVSPC